jgi:hypothetical protein
MSSGELPASARLSTSAAAAFGSNRAARSPRIRSLPETSWVTVDMIRRQVAAPS